MVDLTKRIKINDNYQITYGRLLLIFLLTLFEVLGILCLNDWVLVPEVFFTLANAFMLLSKRPTDEQMEQIEKRIDKNLDKIIRNEALVCSLNNKIKVIIDNADIKSEDTNK